MLPGSGRSAQNSRESGETMTEEIQETPEQAREPVMVNTSVIDKALYYEGVQGREKGWKSRILILLGIVIAVIGLLMNWKPLAVLGVLLSVGYILAPTVIGHRDYKKLCMVHPEGSWTKTVTFYEDRLETDSGNGKPTVVKYKDIRREIETEHLYILDFGKKAPASLFRKDSFTQGSMEELKPFLLERQRAAYDTKPGKSKS
jgi:hypothetical protein